MRKTLARILIISMSVMLFSILLNSCRKTDHTNATTEQADLRTTESSRTEHPRNRSVPAGLVKNGVVYPLTGASNTQVNSGGGGATTGCQNYTHTIGLTYIGFYDQASSCSDDRDFFMTWQLDMPADITPLTSSSSTLAMWKTSYQGSWNNIAISINYSTSYMHPTEGILMNRYVVQYNFTIPNQEYCGNDYVLHWFNIETDCQYAQIVSPASWGPINDSFDDPGIYQVYPYYAINATTGSTHRFQAFPLTLVCTPCHGPELGNSPLHEFRYRVYNSNVWSTVQRTDLFSFYQVVDSAGTYEYQSRGKLDPSGTWTAWTPSDFVVVQ